MVTSDEEALEEELEVQISALEHYSYCPRQCGLIHVEQTYEENVYTMRGRLSHERVDAGSEAASRGVASLRAIPLWSERLGLRGKADLVEMPPEGPYPVEHKVGREEIQHRVLRTKVPIGLIPHVQARLLARHLRNELTDYPPFLYR